MLKDKVVVVAFNAILSDGCDYAIQTLRLVGRHNYVYGLLLGEPITWKDILKLRVKPMVQRAYNSMLIRPFFVLPGQRSFVVKQINYFINSIVVRLILSVRHPRSVKILWFFEPWNIVPVFWALRGYVSFYDCIDYYEPLAYEAFSHERYLIRSVNLMTCIAQVLAHKHRKYRDDIRIVPLGFSEDAVSASGKRKKYTKTKRFTVGFIGGINYRIDFPLLFRVIASLPNTRFVFAGPIQKVLMRDESSLDTYVHRLFSYQNVTYLGALAKEDVTHMLKTCDMGIIPYDVRLAFNRYSFPMKLMEYFWFGLPVLATDIASLRQFGRDVALCATSGGWIQTIDLERKKKPSNRDVVRRRRIAVANSWEKKIEVISSILDAYRATEELVLRP